MRIRMLASYMSPEDGYFLLRQEYDVKPDVARRLIQSRLAVERAAPREPADRRRLQPDTVRPFEAG